MSSKFQTRSKNIFFSQKRRAAIARKSLQFTLDELRAAAIGCLGLPCGYCREEVTEENFSADHAQPVARGGDFTLINTVFCCERCNKAKGMLTLQEFQGILAVVTDYKARKDLIARLLVGGKYIRN